MTTQCPVAARSEVRPSPKTHVDVGLVIFAEGDITLWLLVSLSTVNFVLFKGGAILTLTLTAAVGTVVWSVTFGREEGILGSPVLLPRARPRVAADDRSATRSVEAFSRVRRGSRCRFGSNQTVAPARRAAGQNEGWTS
jgi:hypothetical protein